MYVCVCGGVHVSLLRSQKMVSGLLEPELQVAVSHLVGYKCWKLIYGRVACISLGLKAFHSSTKESYKTKYLVGDLLIASEGEAMTIMVRNMVAGRQAKYWSSS